MHKHENIEHIVVILRRTIWNEKNVYYINILHLILWWIIKNKTNKGIFFQYLITIPARTTIGCPLHNFLNGTQCDTSDYSRLSCLRFYTLCVRCLPVWDLLSATHRYGTVNHSLQCAKPHLQRLSAFDIYTTENVYYNKRRFYWK